jgi:hypothetical protein
MKKYIIISILFCACYCNAQVTVKLSQLAGTTWKTVKPNDTKILRMWTFSSKGYKRYMVYTMYDNRKSEDLTYSFYLDPVNSYKFEHSKVGVSKKGCYIHGYNRDGSDLWTIEAFDEGKGTMTISNASMTLGLQRITQKKKLKTFTPNNPKTYFDGRKLIGKKWYYSDIFNGVRETRTMIFDKDSVKETIVRGNKTIIRHDAYYLDDYAAMEFWPLYVGKKSHGRFLFRGAKDGMVGVIIHKLTDDEFIYSFYRRSPLIKFTAMPLK